MKSPDDPTIETVPAPDRPRDDEAPTSTSIAGRYAILSMLGGGGMGRVYLARDTELDELVAVKMLQPDFVKEPDALALLRKEVKLARRVTHPNVARTYDIDVHEGQRFITMEFVEGESLGSILKHGAMSLSAFLDVARALCDGLAAAHAAGIVHRDLKPANVLVAEGGRAVITDFGIACLATSLDAWKVSGTPRYMAPEQIDGHAADARTDIYALGLVFFEMLAGRRPFATSDWKEEVLRRLTEPPPDLAAVAKVPESIATIVRRAMATSPEHRYASVLELRLALATVAVEPVVAPVVRRETPAAALSVAVLRPRVVGDVPEGLDEHFADTLRTLGLRVPSCAAVAAMSLADPRELGRALDVDAVLVSSLARDGAHVEAEASLVAVADGVALFHRRTRVLADHLTRWALRVVSDVGGAVRARPENGMMSAAHLQDRETLDLYVQARRLYHQSWGAPNDQACALLERALALKPDDPMLLAAFAAVLARRCGYGAEHELERARAAMVRARALAPWSPEAHVASASLHMQLAEYEEAMTELRNTLRIAPWHPEAHARLGELLAEAGSTADAVEHLTTAAALEPAFKTSSAWTIARHRALEGDVVEADRVLGPPPAEEWLRNQYFMQRGRIVMYASTPARIAALRDAIASSAFEIKPLMEAFVDAVASGSGIEMVAGVVARSGGVGVINRRISFFQLLRCELLAHGGHADEALEALGVACDAGLADVFWVERCKLVDALRSHERFAGLAALIRERSARVVASYRAA